MKIPLDRIDLSSLIPKSHSNVFYNLNETARTIIEYLVNSKKLSQAKIDKIGNIISESLEYLVSLGIDEETIDKYIDRRIHMYILFDKTVDEMGKKEKKKLVNFMKNYEKLIEKVELVDIDEKEIPKMVLQCIDDEKSKKK